MYKASTYVIRQANCVADDKYITNLYEDKMPKTCITCATICIHNFVHQVHHVLRYCDVTYPYPYFMPKLHAPFIYLCLTLASLLSVSWKFAHYHLCANDEGCFIAFPPPAIIIITALISAVNRWAPLAPSSVCLLLCVHSGSLCLCVGQRGVIQRGVLHRNAKT